jgi:hypothetical protein
LSVDTAYEAALQNNQPAPGPAKRVIKKLAAALKSNIDSELPTRGRRVFVATQHIISFLLLSYAIFAPHSIALTQGAYLIGMGAWAVQLAATRRLNQKRSRMDIALFGFFACCVVSSFLSYDPLVSIKGLKSPAFFFAFYFVSNRVRTIRFASFLALALVLSCLVNVAYSAVTLGKGRGLQIQSITPDSAFSNETIAVGDTIIEADDQPVNSPEDLLRIIDSQRGRLRLKLQRKEALLEASIPRRAIKDSEGVGFERLGITTTPGRHFRITGFYSHYETYAEVLQLIAALAVGLLIAIPNKKSGVALFLAAAIPLIAIALILTSTRAAIVGLAVSVAAMAIANSRRRILIAVMVAVVIIFPLGMFAVERSRGISLFDPEEGSTAYRLEVWREALRIIKDNPVVGIGKGSEGKLKERLGLYNDGRLPPGHFHSTPVQIAVWWGLVALIFYFSFMTVFLIETWRFIRADSSGKRWELQGIALGGLGALIAFNVSSFAHFNFGDGEVIMAFWLLTGLAFAIRRICSESLSNSRSSLTPPSPLQDSSNRSPFQQPTEISEPTVRAAKAKQN